MGGCGKENEGAALKPEPHHVFDGQLERGDLPDDLVVSLHLVHTLRQVLQPTEEARSERETEKEAVC